LLEDCVKFCIVTEISLPAQACEKSLFGINAVSIAPKINTRRKSSLVKI